MIKSTLNKVRLFRNPKKESYLALNKILGFYPKNISFYEQALIHKSSSIEDKNGRYRNNERLEFLGDAILDAVIADVVYKKFPTKDEGFLTNTRSKIVKRDTLDRIAHNLGLHKLLVSSVNTHSQKNHILGNALEAFIGAVYLDQGYRKTHRFIVEKIIDPYVDLDIVAKKDVNFKSQLLEWTQKSKVELEFEIIENFVDSNHNQVFQSQVLLNGLVGGIGIGHSKKESEQQASQLAMKKIRTEKSFLHQVLEACNKEVMEPTSKES